MKTGLETINPQEFYVNCEPLDGTAFHPGEFQYHYERGHKDPFEAAKSYIDVNGVEWMALDNEEFVFVDPDADCY